MISRTNNVFNITLVFYAMMIVGAVISVGGL